MTVVFLPEKKKKKKKRCTLNVDSAAGKYLDVNVNHEEQLAAENVAERVEFVFLNEIVSAQRCQRLRRKFRGFEEKKKRKKREKREIVKRAFDKGRCTDENERYRRLGKMSSSHGRSSNTLEKVIIGIERRR